MTSVHVGLTLPVMDYRQNQQRVRPFIVTFVLPLWPPVFLLPDFHVWAHTLPLSVFGKIVQKLVQLEAQVDSKLPLD